MSVRMLQRALRSNQTEQTPAVGAVRSTGDHSDSEADEGRDSPAGNPFDLLGLQDEAEEEEGDVERDSSHQNAAGSASTSAPVPVGPSRSKRKKSKAKKKGKKDDASPSVADSEDVQESVDRLLERLEIGNGEGSSSTSGGSALQNGKAHHDEASQQQPNVLAVNTTHLRAEDELRRIFGSKVIKSVERSGEGAASQRRRQGGMGVRRGGRGLPMRKSVLVVPMDHWPRWNGGISMECVKVEGPIQCFRYQHSASYQEVQTRFEACVASHDPNTILTLLRSHPYHVDSLLALAEVYKQMGEHQQSASLLEQCLYALECAWHPWFNPSLGTCRLDFSWDQNQPLFLSLFRHMQNLGRRGCHRTALEICKFILSLDPTDPLGALFCIDYFALRAEQYEWLERFVDEYETDKSTSLLPNFAFSVAVACYYLECQQRQQSGQSHHHPRSSTKSVKDSGSDTTVDTNKTSSSILIQQALMLHPSALKKIMAKAPIKEDAGWTKIVTHPQFSEASEGGPTLGHLIDIYVERNCLIWRSPELQAWLKEAAAMVTQIADQGLDSRSGSEMANWECIRKEVFRSTENEYKHLHVSEFSDSTSTLPPEDMPRLGFQAHRAGLAGGGEDHLGEGAADDLDPDQLQQAVNQASLQGRNALLVFLQSLIPRMGGGQGGEDATAEEAPPVLLDEDDDDGSDRDDHDLQSLR